VPYRVEVIKTLNRVEVIKALDKIKIIRSKEKQALGAEVLR
jgi:hypothetical protein